MNRAAPCDFEELTPVRVIKSVGQPNVGCEAIHVSLLSLAPLAVPGVDPLILDVHRNNLKLPALAIESNLGCIESILET